MDPYKQRPVSDAYRQQPHEFWTGSVKDSSSQLDGGAYKFQAGQQPSSFKHPAGFKTFRKPSTTNSSTSSSGFKHPAMSESEYLRVSKGEDNLLSSSHKSKHAVHQKQPHHHHQQKVISADGFNNYSQQQSSSQQQQRHQPRMPAASAGAASVGSRETSKYQTAMSNLISAADGGNYNSSKASSSSSSVAADIFKQQRTSSSGSNFAVFPDSGPAKQHYSKTTSFTSEMGGSGSKYSSSNASRMASSSGGSIVAYN